MDNPNLAAALSLAAHGIALCPSQPAKRPQPGVRWRDEATTDPARIASWWRRWPSSLPAFEPGRHKLIVVDCDRHGGEDGVAALDRLARENDDDPRDWPTIETPSTGRHIFFAQDGSLTNARGTLPAGIDIRGSGGYVIAEGATLADGRSYHPLGDGLIASLECEMMPRLPAWLAGMLEKPAEVTTSSASIPKDLSQKSTPAVTASSGGQSEFFRQTNDAALARLGEWVPVLFPRARAQPGTGAFRISSRDLGRNLQEDLSLAPTGIVDFGVHDMGDPRGGKRTPIDIIMEYGGAPDAVEAARWLCAKLGLDAADRWDESRRDPDIDLSALRPRGQPASAEPEEVDEQDEEEAAPEPLDERLTHVRGVLGEVIDFIVSTSRRPNRRLALSAALPLLGTLLGRRMATPTGAGLMLYVISTYPTGGGKQHQLDAIDRLMRAVDLSRHVGPAQFMSMSSLVRHAANCPLSICPQDEFGAMLKRLSHPRASGHEMGISMVLRSLWGASFATVRTPAYATSSSTEILAPSLSLYGPTTADELYEALRGRDVVNGFLNRFIVIDGGERVEETKPAASLRDVPDGLRLSLHRLYTMGMGATGNLGAVCKNLATDPEPMRVPWQSQDAEDFYLAASRRIQVRMDEDRDAEPFMARVAEIALRCATILACGEDIEAPTVTLDNIKWGFDLAEGSADRLIADASRFMVDPLGAAELERKLLARAREEGDRGVRMRDLHRHLQRHFRFSHDLRNAIDALERAGRIRVVRRPISGGESARVFYLG